MNGSNIGDIISALNNASSNISYYGKYLTNNKTVQMFMQLAYKSVEAALIALQDASGIEYNEQEERK